MQADRDYRLAMKAASEKWEGKKEKISKKIMKHSTPVHHCKVADGQDLKREFMGVVPVPKRIEVSLIGVLTHLLTHSLTYSPAYSLTYSLTCLLTYSLNHSLTHSLTHSGGVR